jgi:pyridoxine/pyridoxamine 5'-phosphate oxidase
LHDSKLGESGKREKIFATAALHHDMKPYESRTNLSSQAAPDFHVGLRLTFFLTDQWRFWQNA